MQHFQNPKLLYLLALLIPIAILITYYIKWQRKTLSQIGKPSLVKLMVPQFSTKLSITRAALIVTAVIMIVIGLSNPRKGIKEEKVTAKGIDVMILLDVSNSMYAQDIQPNRLERSKLLISKLLAEMSPNRVGFIIFAGNAFLQVPVTMDYGAIKLALPYANPEAITSQGTSIGEAVRLAVQSLGTKSSKHKAIIILTDGEDNEGEAEAAIAEAKQVGITTLAVGIGEEEGAPIPMGNDYKRDQNGEIVKTAFNRKILENLASIGNGAFYHLGKQGDVSGNILAHLNQIEKKQYEEFDYSSFESYFFIPLLIALFLIFIEYLIPSIKSIRVNQAVLMIALVSIHSMVHAQKSDIQKSINESNKHLRSGNSEYNKGQYQKAETKYRKALTSYPNNTPALYNLGNAIYSQGKPKDAIAQYQLALKSVSDPKQRAMIYHNLGNAYYKSQQTKEAIVAYQEALKLVPSDMDTKINLALAKRKDKNNGGGGGQNNNNQNKDNKSDQGQSKESQDKQNQDKNDSQGQSKESKESQDQDKQNQGNDGDTEKPKNGEMSKEQAKSLLEALKNQEQNTQNKVNRQNKESKPKKFEKDW